MVHLTIIMFIILTDYAELYFCLYLSLASVVSYPSMLCNLIMDLMSILDVCLPLMMSFCAHSTASLIFTMTVHLGAPMHHFSDSGLSLRLGPFV